MKRRGTSSKAAALARQRALIRALIEQGALTPANPESHPANERPSKDGGLVANLIEFPRQGK